MSITTPTPGGHPDLDLTGVWTPRPTGEVLAHWAAVQPDRVAHEFIDYLADRKGVRHSHTWAEWDVWTKAIANRLQQLAGRSDRVAILAPQSDVYVAAFHAALRAGVVAVPLFQPDLPGHGDRLDAVFDDCRPSVVVTTGDKVELVEKFLSSRGMTGQVAILLPEELKGAAGDADAAAFVPPAELSVDDVAYLQYTSGSTRIPRGVVLTHRNLLCNLYQIVHAHSDVGAAVPDVTTVSWLPLFHDMGLLTGAAAALAGVKSVVFDPLAFILKPSRWITELGAHANVLTAAPNFAYALAAKKMKPEELAGLDLSRVLALVNGAEPILPSTLQRFEETFRPCGLPELAQRPSYGMAEATLFVSARDPQQPLTTVDADVEQLQRGLLRPAATGARSTRLVACGRTFGQHVAIVDPDTGRIVPDGKIGEIWISGDNVGREYWGKPDETARTFGARLVAEDAAAAGLPEAPWLRSGDLGALREGQLYVTGRQKDLIIIDGRNIYPQDIEFSVEHADPGIALHRLAAFSVPTEDGEGIVVVAERYRNAADAVSRVAEIEAAARKAVSEQHSIGLHEFVLIEPDTIPWTSSGKIARQATRGAYLDDELTRVARRPVE